MKIWLSRRFVVLLGCLVVMYAAQGQGDRGPNTAIQPANPDALILQEFKKRVDAYVELRKKLKKQTPALKETKNPAEIQVAQEALAAKIREARKAAKPGEIFTPEVRELFRRLMNPEVKGPQGAETRQVHQGGRAKGRAAESQREVSRRGPAADRAAEHPRHAAQASRGSRIPHHQP